MEEGQRVENNEKSFGELLDSFDYQRPERGQVLQGEIMVIEQDAILLDVGLKRDAIVPARELSQTDEELLQKLRVGDRVPVYVIQPGSGNEEMWVSLQRAVEDQNWDQAKEDLEKETLLDLEVTGQNRGGLLVQYKQLEGFVPNSHIPGLQRDLDQGQMRNFKSDWIGKQMSVKMIEVDRQRRKLVFSATFAQEEKRQKRLLELKLNVGQVVRGQVVNVVEFGVFVDLDGVDGLVHVSELDWGRVEDPGNLFNPGDEIEVEVVEVDIDRERVTLSRKNLMPNPWNQLADRYNVGEVIECEIVQIMDFGAFVQLEEGVQGLIPKNELGYAHTDIPQEAVKSGDKVIARILSIDPEEGRMALSMRQVPREKQIDWLLSDVGGLEMEGEDKAEMDTTAESETETQKETSAESEPEPQAESAEQQEGEATGAESQTEAESTEASAEAQAESTAGAKSEEGAEAKEAQRDEKQA